VGAKRRPENKKWNFFRAVPGFRLSEKIINGIITQLKVKNANEMAEEQREMILAYRMYGGQENYPTN
jgi:hypothetical protein